MKTTSGGTLVQRGDPIRKTATPAPMKMAGIKKEVKKPVTTTLLVVYAKTREVDLLCPSLCWLLARTIVLGNEWGSAV